MDYFRAYKNIILHETGYDLVLDFKKNIPTLALVRALQTELERGWEVVGEVIRVCYHLDVRALGGDSL